MIETMDKLKGVADFIGTTNLWAVLVGVICMVILIGWQFLPDF